MKGYRWDGSSGSQEGLTRERERERERILGSERLDRTWSFVKRETARKD